MDKQTDGQTRIVDLYQFLVILGIKIKLSVYLYKTPSLPTLVILENIIQFEIKGTIKAISSVSYKAFGGIPYFAHGAQIPHPLFFYFCFVLILG